MSRLAMNKPPGSNSGYCLGDGSDFVSDVMQSVDARDECVWAGRLPRFNPLLSKRHKLRIRIRIEESSEVDSLDVEPLSVTA